MNFLCHSLEPQKFVNISFLGYFAKIIPYCCRSVCGRVKFEPDYPFKQKKPQKQCHWKLQQKHTKTEYCINHNKEFLRLCI